MSYFTNDPVADWDRYCADQERAHREHCREEGKCCNECGEYFLPEDLDGAVLSRQEFWEDTWMCEVCDAGFNWDKFRFDTINPQTTELCALQVKKGDFLVYGDRYAGQVQTILRDREANTITFSFEDSDRDDLTVHFNALINVCR